MYPPPLLVFEERVDLSNDMTGWQMIAVGIRRLVLARGELDRLEGPGYAARRTELRRKAKEAARTRDRQAAAPQGEAEENDATEEEVTRERTTRVGRPRGGMNVAARSGERLRKKIFLASSPPPRLGTEPIRTQERWDCASPPLALTAQDSVPR